MSLGYKASHAIHSQKKKKKLKKNTHTVEKIFI